MSKVIFIQSTREELERGEKNSEILSALKEFGFAEFTGEKVLVKLHMGESGNEYYIKPNVTKHFVDPLKELNAKPFLYDTAVKYFGGRNTKEKYSKTAKEHGFDKIGNVIIGNEGKTVNVKVNKSVYGFEVADEVCGSENILSVAHGKGHMMTGFGGSIKAFGMGGVSKESKGFIHAAGAPILEDEDACQLCGICAESCPRDAIKVDKRWNIDYGKCFGCERCVESCPHDALKWKGEDFDLMLAAGSCACLNKFDSNNKLKNKIFVNVLVDISKHCDCASNAGPIISPDIGIVISDDPVAIDNASIDLIKEFTGKSLKEIQGVDPKRHVRYGEVLGMGEMKYELIKFNEQTKE